MTSDPRAERAEPAERFETSPDVRFGRRRRVGFRAAVLVLVLGLVVTPPAQSAWRGGPEGSEASRAAVPAVLQPYLGSPFVVEIPTLERLGQPLPGLPRGWRGFQADAENVESLQALLGVDQPPALGIFDAHGNCLVVDRSFSRARWSSRIQEFGRRAARLEKELGDTWKDAEAYRERSREDRRELDKLLEVVGAQSAIGVPLRGYPVLEKARVRLLEIDRELWTRLVVVMAAEGLVSRRVLASRLENLESRARGLPVAREISRRRDYLRRGLVGERRRQS